MVERLATEQSFLLFIIQFPVELCFTYSGCGMSAAICKETEASLSLSLPGLVFFLYGLVWFCPDAAETQGVSVLRWNRDSTPPCHPTHLQKPFCCDTRLVKLHLRTSSAARHGTKTVIKIPAAHWKPAFSHIQCRLNTYSGFHRPTLQLSCYKGPSTRTYCVTRL